MAEQHEQVLISSLMESSGVKFGTSGARGLASDMTDRVCYAYTLGFLQYLESISDVQAGGLVAIAGDFRSSSPRIMNAVAMAVTHAGYQPLNCGFIPTPAVASYAMGLGVPSIMITGSHIPDDRNGIKYYKSTGEILKKDEQALSALDVQLPLGLFDSTGLFDSANQAVGLSTLPPISEAAERAYVARYLDFFPAGCLAGYKIGVYQHSTVCRDMLAEVMRGLGAEVICLGRSKIFIPVDTEAIRPEDVALAIQWAAEFSFDCIVSADGDGDRPLVSDEHGNWLRGDVAGILCARYLAANCIATPVSCNSAVEKCGWFERIERTRIGSPFVIEAMNAAIADGANNVIGYEANGGFLTATDIALQGHVLHALPTRDAMIVPLAILMLAKAQDNSISDVLADLPQRYTYSGRLKNFSTELSRCRLAALQTGDASADKAAAEILLGDAFGSVSAIDVTDGVRITFASDEVVHLRPSGNAPELRCYNEADSQQRAAEMNRVCLTILESWRPKCPT